jgi:hypothetical protein
LTGWETKGIFDFLIKGKSKMPRGGKRDGSGRPPGAYGKNKTLRDKVEDLSRNLPVPVPPKRLVNLDDKDAAAQADDIMQFAGREMRKAKSLMEAPPDGKDAPTPTAVRDEFMTWANLVLRVASMLLPYQRPTYRSIEVRTDRGIEERQTRYIGDPAERLAQIVVGAILRQPDATFLIVFDCRCSIPKPRGHGLSLQMLQVRSQY